MRQALTIVILICLFTGMKSQVYYSCVPTGVVCDYGCCCQPNNTCTSCSIFFGDDGGGCVPCNHFYCVSCSFPGGEICNSCLSPYQKNIDQLDQCVLCNQSTATGCQPLNHCHSAKICTTCIRYYIEPSINRCIPCGSNYRNCEECNTTVCITCVSNFYLNYTTYRQCVRCFFPNCQGCVHGPRCSSCASGFYLDSNTDCQPCIDPCLTCSNNVSCNSCNQTGDLYYLSGNACQPCSNMSPNCLTCPYSGSSYSCNSCLDGYYLSGTCTSCPTNCSTCTSSTTCQSCIDAQHYLDSSNMCQACSSAMPNCTYCASSTVCLECIYGYVVVFQSSNCTSCDQILSNCVSCTNQYCLICKNGTVMVNGRCQINLNCNPNCYSCYSNSPITCVLCYSGYYLVTINNTCAACSSPCVTCRYDTSSSSLNCLSCPYGYFLNNTQCVLCQNGTYYLNTIRGCYNCSIYCKTCLVLGCITCESDLFVVSSYNGLCQDLCGDGYVVTLPCDGGKGIPNDGCAENCTIQPNYSCTYISTTNPFFSSTASVSTSKCSYLLQPTLSIYKATQSLTANRLTLAFKVTPYLYGLPFGNETQAYLRSIFLLLPLDTTTNYNIIPNPADGTVAFDIFYSADISTSPLNFTVNFAALSTDPMFQNVTNQNINLGMDSIVAAGRLGKYYEASEYSSNKAMYAVTSIISGINYLFLAVGLLARELAGLEQMLMCQTVFMLVLFRPEYNFYLQGLLGFKFSLGFDIFGSQVGGVNNYPGYLYNINTDSLINNFNINFLLIIVPALISPIFMLYRIKNKHLPVKRDFGRSASQVFIGEMLLYFVIYNFYGLFSYSYLYLHSPQQDEILNLVLFVFSVLFTLFAWWNFVFRPEVVGCFRSAFSSYKSYGDSQPKQSKLAKKMDQCISWRFNAENWKQGYRLISINFYFLLLIYQIAASFLIIKSLTLGIVGLQGFIFLLLLVVKPYLKPSQKLRSIFTYSILLFSNLINIMQIKTTLIPTVLIALIGFHLLITAFIVIKASYFQFKKKFTNRKDVVESMFKQDKQLKADQLVQQQLKVVNHLIKQYHDLDISKKNQQRTIQRHLKEQAQKEEDDFRQEVSDNEHLYTEERILGEQNKHLRYVAGMDFLYRYGNQVNQQIVNKHYSGI